jgi:hypothetical protein
MAGTLKYTEDWQTLPWKEIVLRSFVWYHLRAQEGGLPLLEAVTSDSVGAR